MMRTFANVCSISDRRVLQLLPPFELETSDPLFDDSWSCRPDTAETDYLTAMPSRQNADSCEGQFSIAVEPHSYGD
jgi:hypothetical protein